jgi:hypothetical protein
MTNSATNPAQKTVAQWASNMRVTEYEFLSVVAYAMEQFNEGNATEISKLLTIVSGRTSKIIKVNAGDRTSFAGPLMRVLYAAGMTNKKDTGLPMSFKWDAKKASGVTYTKSDNANFSLEVIKSLRVLGKTRVSDKAFKEAFPAIPTQNAPKTNDQIREQVQAYIAKIAKDTGLSVAIVQAMASAPIAKAA